jgi:hypothetical protein
VSVDRRRGIDFFVSYTGADEGWAEWIAWQLKEAGSQVRLQKWHFDAGSDFMAEMDEAVRKAQRTIAVLSPAYLRSAYCQAEWRNIFTTDVDGRDRRLVPVCIEKCPAKDLGLLKTRVYIDLTKCADGESARQTLRRSAETMFAMEWPQHVVSGWIGHSVQVSLKHYVQTPDSVFEAASERPALRAAVTPRNAGNRPQRPQRREMDERWKASPAQAKTRTVPEVAAPYGLFPEVGGGGFEPPTPGFSILCSTN